MRILRTSTHTRNMHTLEEVMERIVICGAAGRMGRRLTALAVEDGGFALTGAVEAPGHPALGQDAGELAGVGALGVKLVDSLDAALSGAECAIAFSNSPEASIAQAAVCAAASVPLVVGTTGFTQEQDADFARAAEGIPAVKATNFSVGIAVLMGLVEQASRMLGESFDCEIVESHHTKKKDAPSGTAKSLGEAAAAGRGWKLANVACHGREGITGERPTNQIGIHAVRAGDIVGHHTVLFGGTGETVELIHRAQSRDNFASGALRAARWAPGQKPGIYSMRDVLGL